MRDDSQLSRFVATKQTLKEKILRLHSPIGSYQRNGVNVPEQALALYIGLNPKSLPRANKNLLVEMARRCANGDMDFNPISLATSEIHTATTRKFFVDFDFDDVPPHDIDGGYGYLSIFQDILPKDSYKILISRGGFHLIVVLEKVKQLKTNWYVAISSLPRCDVRGSSTLTPVPGCAQGGFSPYFLD